jgi:hypothetical protein
MGQKGRTAQKIIPNPMNVIEEARKFSRVKQMDADAIQPAHAARRLNPTKIASAAPPDARPAMVR